MQRFKGNPILTAADLPANTGYFILNPGAVKFNGEYLLLVDVFHVEGGIIFWIARSRDGYRFRFDPKPVDWPRPPSWWNENGVYDPRITQIGNEYFICYGSHDNTLGTRIAFAKTRDFESFEFISVGSEINNRNGALFPEKINGLYCRLDRPFGGGEQSPCDHVDELFAGPRLLGREPPGHDHPARRLGSAQARRRRSADPGGRGVADPLSRRFGQL